MAELFPPVLKGYAVRPRAKALGLELISVGIRDVIMPGEMKDLMNRVTEAKKAAEAGAGHDPVRRAADAHGVPPQQVVLAWLLSLSPAVIPIPGASRPESILDSVQAVDLELSEDELEAIAPR